MAEQKEDIIRFENPQRESKPEYIGTFFALYLQLSRIISSPELTKSPVNASLMSDLIIMMIPGKEQQIALKAKDELHNKLIADYLKTHPEKTRLSMEEENYLLLKASVLSLGNVTNFIDKHIGVSTENRVGIA